MFVTVKAFDEFVNPDANVHQFHYNPECLWCINLLPSNYVIEALRAHQIKLNQMLHNFILKYVTTLV